jgi:hypothetical protein
MGDIGRLDDQIKALPYAMNEALAPTLGALVTASKEAQNTIVQLGAEQKASLQNFSAGEKNAVREVIKKVLQEEAGNALANAARELATSARIHQDATKHEASARWQWIAVAFAVGMGATAMTIYGLHLLYGQEFEKQALYGRALGSVWDNLDAKTKKRIQDAL